MVSMAVHRVPYLLLFPASLLVVTNCLLLVKPWPLRDEQLPTGLIGPSLVNPMSGKTD